MGGWEGYVAVLWTCGRAYGNLEPDLHIAASGCKMVSICQHGVYGIYAVRLFESIGAMGCERGLECIDGCSARLIRGAVGSYLCIRCCQQHFAVQKEINRKMAL